MNAQDPSPLGDRPWAAAEPEVGGAAASLVPLTFVALLPAS